MKVIASLAAVAALAAAGSVTAQDMRIAWSDLDLGSTAGSAAFDKRVDVASRRFCSAPQQPGTLIVRSRECREQVRRAAVAGLPAAAQADYAQARQSLSV